MRCRCGESRRWVSDLGATPAPTAGPRAGAVHGRGSYLVAVESAYRVRGPLGTGRRGCVGSRCDPTWHRTRGEGGAGGGPAQVAPAKREVEPSR